MLEILGLSLLAVIYVMLLCGILKIGLMFAFDHSHRWFGGLPLWMAWALWWVLVPPLLISNVLGVLL